MQFDHELGHRSLPVHVASAERFLWPPKSTRASFLYFFASTWNGLESGIYYPLIVYQIKLSLHNFSISGRNTLSI